MDDEVVDVLVGEQEIMEMLEDACIQIQQMNSTE
jgi:hypothetical protein